MVNQQELTDFSELKSILEKELIIEKCNINVKLSTIQRKEVHLNVENSDSESENKIATKSCNKHDLLNSKIDKHKLLRANLLDRYSS